MDDNPLLPNPLDVVSAGAVVGFGVMVVALLVFVVVRLRSNVRTRSNTVASYPDPVVAAVVPTVPEAEQGAGVSPIEVPSVIETYQRGHDRRDTDSALASFGPDATVIDEGVAHVGTERIRWWLMNAASEYTYTRTFTGAEDLGDGVYLVHNHLSGDFPGGEADLRYRFELRDGLIQRVEIAP